MLLAIPGRGGVAVTGEALSLGVESRDASLANAKRQNDAVVRKVLGVFRQFAIDPTDVQTDFMTVEIGTTRRRRRSWTITSSRRRSP